MGLSFWKQHRNSERLPNSFCLLSPPRNVAIIWGTEPLRDQSLESFLLPPICYLRTHLLGLPCHLDVKIVIVLHEKMKDFMAHLLVF